MKSILIGLLLISWSFATDARVIHLTDVTNNSSQEKYDYKLLLNVNSENKVVKFYTDSYLIGNHQAGRQKRVSHNIGNLKNGFVLVKRQGYNVAILKSDDFISNRGGTLTLSYLFIGNPAGPPGGSYRSKTVKLVSYGNSWGLYDGNNTKINKVAFKINKILGKEVGVKRVQFN